MARLAPQPAEVIAYVVVLGDRSRRANLPRRLWGRIPEEYKRGCCYSDFWEAYRAVIPERSATRGVGKESGDLAHVEKRCNNTLGQGLARFVRKSFRSPSPMRCTRFV